MKVEITSTRLHGNLGKETLNKEYKEFVLNPDDLTRESIDEITNRGFNTKMERLIHKTYERYLHHYLPKYFMCLSDIETNEIYSSKYSQLYVGVDDSGNITGIPMVNIDLDHYIQTTLSAIQEIMHELHGYQIAYGNDPSSLTLYRKKQAVVVRENQTIIETFFNNLQVIFYLMDPQQKLPNTLIDSRINSMNRAIERVSHERELYLKQQRKYQSDMDHYLRTISVYTEPINKVITKRSFMNELYEYVVNIPGVDVSLQKYDRRRSIKEDEILLDHDDPSYTPYVLERANFIHYFRRLRDDRKEEIVRNRPMKPKEPKALDHVAVCHLVHMTERLEQHHTDLKYFMVEFRIPHLYPRRGLMKQIKNQWKTSVRQQDPSDKNNPQCLN